MNVFRDTTVATNSQQKPETLYAAGYHLTPGRIGVQRVKAWIVALVGVAALYASIRAADELAEPAIVLLGLAIAVGCVIYSWSVIEGIQQVKRLLWNRELDAGDDLDGDGRIGPPPTVGHILRIGGQRDVTLPDLDPPKRLAALVGFPTNPPVTPNDVLWILTSAAQDGLGFRTWYKRRLPSGAEINRDLWTGILDGLITWSFAVATTGADGRRTVTLRSDVDLETMTQAIRKSVETPVSVVQ